MMKMATWALSIIATTAAGCSGSGAALRARQLANGAAYLETNRFVWLTPEQRSYLLCQDGQALLCVPAAGRLSAARCRCPLTGPDGKGASAR